MSVLASFKYTTYLKSRDFQVVFLKFTYKTIAFSKKNRGCLELPTYLLSFFSSLHSILYTVIMDSDDDEFY